MKSVPGFEEWAFAHGDAKIDWILHSFLNISYLRDIEGSGFDMHQQ